MILKVTSRNWYGETKSRSTVYEIKFVYPVQHIGTVHCYVSIDHFDKTRQYYMIDPDNPGDMVEI